LIFRAIGTSRKKITAIFVFLSILDLICIFREVKNVVFTSMNFERAGIVLNHLFSGEHVRGSTDSDSDLLNYVDDNIRSKKDTELNLKSNLNKKLSSRDFIVPVDENEGTYLFFYL
jgi:hypothetical protein